VRIRGPGAAGHGNSRHPAIITSAMKHSAVNAMINSALMLEFATSFSVPMPGGRPYNVLTQN
jgi:hypothetical protein